MRVLAVADDTDPNFIRLRRVIRAVAENDMDISFVLLVHKEDPDTPALSNKLEAISRMEGTRGQVQVVETSRVIYPAYTIADKAKSEGAMAVFVPEEMEEIIKGLEVLFEGKIAIEIIGGAYPVKDMMTSPPISIRPEYTAQEAASVLRQRDITSTVVMRDGVPVGLLTMSDLLKVVQGGQSSRDVKVEDIMTTPLHTIEAHQAALTAAKVMAEKGARILGVTDRGELIGVITATDFFKLPPKEMERFNSYLAKIIRMY
jgi:CBS domain-containing protein